MQIPITIITGFLGAGKTTLLNTILHNNQGLRIAVLVNDFGSVNIDSELIVGVEGESVSLSNGCICCTIRDDLLKAVFSVIQRDNPPEYLIVETSGVSDPFAVAETFLMPALRPLVTVDSIVTVVDAEQVRDLRGDQEVLAMDQISAADIIVMNKVDLVDKEGLSAARSFIREIVPDARILEVIHGRAPLELLLGVGEYSIDKLKSREKRDVHVHAAVRDEEHDHVHSDHTMVFNTWTYSADEPLLYKELCDAIDNLPVTIFRAKGFVQLKESPERKAVVHIVGKRAQLTFSGAWGEAGPHTQIVLIGTQGSVNAEKLQVLFDRARASVAEASKSNPAGEALSWVRKMWPEKFKAK
jgi:G3E family GTPase